MTKRNLAGQKIEKLTVISQAPNVVSKNGLKSDVAWNCQCECGKIIVVRTRTLTNGCQKSCGCDRGILKPGQQFNYLTTISYDRGHWDCICVCGNRTSVLTHHLICGNTKSCGCLKTEKSKLNIRRAIKQQTIYDPKISSARKLWRSYGALFSFDQFLELTQKDCFYCGESPNNHFNGFKYKKDASQYSKDNGCFTYNGLDRVDNLLGHALNNVVPCCITCNRAKCDRTIDQFYVYIDGLRVNDSFVVPGKLLEMPEDHSRVSIKGVYKHYVKNYGIMEMDLLTFYTMSQLPCFYCGMEKQNCYNVYLHDPKSSQFAKDTAYFRYNGIDRLDSSKGHTIMNSVPCCKYCNLAKGDKLSMLEFQAWIQRIQGFQKCRK